RRRDIRVGRPVEADVAIADLNEPKTAAATHRHRTVRRLFDGRSFQDTTCHGPQRSGAHPRHAPQETATIPFLLVLLNHRCLLSPDAAGRRASYQRNRPVAGRIYSA